MPVLRGSRPSTARSAGSPRSASSGRAKRRGRPRLRGRVGGARPLEGIPFGVKDLFDSEGVRTAYGSPMFAEHVPARDAEAVRARPRRGRDPRREDPDARVRLGDHLRQRAHGLGAQPLGARAGLRRVERRLRGRARSRGGAAHARQRHRRLDPRARVVLRRRRAEADVRPDQRGAGLAARAVARSSRARWRGRRRTRRCCSRRSPGSTTTTRRPRTCRSATCSGDAGPRRERPRRRHLPRPRARPARRLHPRGLRRRRCRRSSGPARRLVEVALPEAALDPPGVPDDPERRGARHAPARGPLSRLGAASTAPMSSAGSSGRAGHARGVPRRVRRARADPRGVRTRFRSCDVLLTPVSAGSPLPIGDETVVHEGRGADVPRARDELHDAAGPRGLPACAVRAGFDALGSRSACSSRRRRGRRRACCARHRGSST